jgi:hypothetical protein
MVQPVMERLREAVEMALSSKVSENSTPSAIPEAIATLYRYLYYLTKVRGYKTIGIEVHEGDCFIDDCLPLLVKFFTHEAADLEPLLAYVKTIVPNNFAHWEVRYILLLWLSLVARIPFDLTRLDSGHEDQRVS